MKGIGYGSPKPKRGGDEDADHYESAEEVNWKDLESGKLWEEKKKDWSLASSKKKKELTHVYSHSHRAVHTSRRNGEKAWILTSSRTRWSG